MLQRNLLQNVLDQLEEGAQSDESGGWHSKSGFTDTLKYNLEDQPPIIHDIRFDQLMQKE